jgi:hypothetical protein
MRHSKSDDWGVRVANKVAGEAFPEELENKEELEPAPELDVCAELEDSEELEDGSGLSDCVPLSTQLKQSAAARSRKI